MKKLIFVIGLSLLVLGVYAFFVNKGVSLYREGQSLKGEGRYVEAINKFTQMQKYPLFGTSIQPAKVMSETFYHWGRQVFETSSYGEAVSKYQMSIDADPAGEFAKRSKELLPEAYFRLANQQLKAQQPEAAKQSLMKLMSDYSESPFTNPAKALLYEMASGFHHKGDYETAASIYKFLVEKDPSGRYGKEAQAKLKQKEIRVALEEAVTLREALNGGYVQANITGVGLSAVNLSLTKTEKGSKNRLVIIIPAGTFFVNKGYAQDMISTEERRIEMTKTQSVAFTIPAACANFHKPEPGSGDTFTVLDTVQSKDLQKLMTVIRQENPPEVVKQVAIWAVTDNPTRQELDRTYTVSYLGSPLGGSPAASDEDIRETKRILELAGISTRDKHLFRK